MLVCSGLRFEIGLDYNQFTTTTLIEKNLIQKVTILSIHALDT